MRRSLQPLIPYLSCLALAAGATAKDDKPKPDQLVASHLAALGSAEKRAAVKSRAATGTVQVVFRLGAQGQLSGPAALLSVGHKARINWAFNQLEYPGEQFGFDGSRVTVGLVRPGVRSNLSEFIYQFDYLLKEGLLGGVLATGWALLEVPERQPKLDVTGLKKIEGKQLHEVSIAFPWHATTRYLSCSRIVILLSLCLTRAPAATNAAFVASASRFTATTTPTVFAAT